MQPRTRALNPKQLRVPKKPPPPEETGDNAATDKKSSLRSRPLPMAPRVEDFPDQPLGNGGPPPTIENLAFLCAFYKIFVGYNVIKKQLVIRMKDHSGMTDNAANTAITHVQSLAAKCGMGISFVPALLAALGDRNPFNPVADWIRSKPWDGEDRLFEGIERRAEHVFVNPKTGRPYTDIKHPWETTRAEAGLEDLHLHDLRHSAASFMVNAGVDLFAVGRILGHADHQSTMRYAHLADTTLLAAVEAGAAKMTERT